MFLAINSFPYYTPKKTQIIEGVKLKLLSNLDIRFGDFYVTNRAQEQLSICDIFHFHIKINNYILRKSKS